ncbi:MAG: GAF domain-containing protein, partial [Anaerolineae bacterium]|nr:GAF domain-containing protein [Anaerolineae bacterium]
TDHYDGWVDFDLNGSWRKSYVAAPIRVGNKVIGFLNVDSSKPNRFNEADADNLQAFADQAAVALRSGALIEHVRHQAGLEQNAYQPAAEVEYERAQMRAIIDAMTEGVAYTEYINGEYHTRYINHALEAISGYSADDWDHYSLNLLRPKGMTDEAFGRMLNGAGAELNTRGYWRYDVRLCRKDGTEYDALTITSRVECRDPDMVCLVTVIRDVSKEKLLQQQKEHFVSYASHELRTPITNLKTRLYLLRNQPERLDEHLVVLEYVTDRMKRLVEDLLDISRFERGVIKLNFRDIVLQDVIGKLVRVQMPEAESKRLLLRCELPDKPIHVDADPERLAQVIINLLTNAINYTPSGGEIVLKLSHFRDVTGDLALVEIQDTGIGINEEHLPHIFQPFYRIASEVEGSGLGLSISKEIIELHGGEIDVSSQPGVGTTFCFWLPMLLNKVGDFRVTGAR